MVITMEIVAISFDSRSVDHKIDGIDRYRNFGIPLNG